MVWLEDVLPREWWDSWLNDTPTYSHAELKAAQEKTRVPLSVEEVPMTHQMAASVEKSMERSRKMNANKTALDKLGIYIPALLWIRTYNWKQWFFRDLMAGLAVAIMAVPQGMSYSQNLAFMPQVYGLYGVFIPCIIYAALGTCRHLSVGPVAVTSLLLGSGLSNMFGDFSINPSHPQDAYEAALQERYNHAAIQVAFIAGFFYFAIGLFRMGWIINFLSLPVMSGFMTGAASIIVATQLKYITGQYLLPRSDTLYHALKLVFDNMGLIRQPEMAMGFSFTAFLVFCIILGKRYKRLRFLLFSGPLIITAIGIIAVYAGDLSFYIPDDKSTPIIKDVGEIPAGMPAFTGGWWLSLYYPAEQVVLALVICLMDIAESTTVARTLAQRNRYKLDFTQELRALGVTNIIGAMFNCYTVTGAFSRSVVNEMAGAVTLMASMVTGILIMIVLLCMTPIFQYTPLNVQGAIVIVAVLPLFDFKSGVFYWRVNKLDWFTWLTSYVVTSMAGALWGLAAAIGLSITIMFLKNAFPRFDTVGQVPGTKDLYKPSAQYPGVSMPEGVVALRVEASLFFGNLPRLRTKIDEMIEDAEMDGEPLHALVLDLEAAADIDGAVIMSLSDIMLDMADNHMTLILAAPSRQAVQALQRANLIYKIGGENIQATVGEAMDRAREVVAAAAVASEDSSPKGGAGKIDGVSDAGTSGEIEAPALTV